MSQQRKYSKPSSEQPPFINLQQFYIEWFLVDRIYEMGTVELRWKNRVVQCQQRRAACPHLFHQLRHRPLSAGNLSTLRFWRSPSQEAACLITDSRACCRSSGMLHLETETVRHTQIRGDSAPCVRT